jgi:hypothetical protein
MPSVLVDTMDVYNGRYGLYRPAYDRHAYSGLTIAQVENPQAFGTGIPPKGFVVPGPKSASVPTPRRAEPNAKGEAPKEGVRLAPEIVKQASSNLVNLGPLIMNPLTTLPDLAEVSASSDAFPAPLEPADDQPPTTAITAASSTGRGELTVRGTTSDGGTVTRVRVNGKEARAVRANFAEWEVVLPLSEGVLELTAAAEDAAGNVEKRPHQVKVGRP